MIRNHLHQQVESKSFYPIEDTSTDKSQEIKVIQQAREKIQQRNETLRLRIIEWSTPRPKKTPKFSLIYLKRQFLSTININDKKTYL